MSNYPEVKAILGLLFVVALIALAVFAVIAQSKSDHDTIENWARENHYEVVSIEKTIFDHGPFWFVDDKDRVYRVKIAGEDRTCYFWFGFLNYEQKWK